MTSKTTETKLDEGILHNKVWIDAWAAEDTAFHRENPDPFLDKREAEMFAGKKKYIFLPLCGKTVDMIWLYNKGHTVSGVEIAEQAIIDFFEENKIENDNEVIENVGKLYKSKDDRLKLYVADAYDMNPALCGQFDIIFDSKAFVAINLADHQLYRDTMLGLMKPDGLYFLSALEYDPTIWPGPPHSIPDKTIKDLFGERCNVEILEEHSDKKLGGEIPVTAENVDITERNPEKPFEKVGKALSKSSYFYTRWYRMTFK